MKRFISWLEECIYVGRKIRTPWNAWDWFVAFFVPRWVLRLHRRIRYWRHW